MNYAPIIRIVLRYGAGAVVGLAQGEMLAGDPDVVSMLAVAVGGIVEAAYAWAKKRGGNT